MLFVGLAVTFEIILTLGLLKLVEIIGDKELDELNTRSLNLIVEIMNRTKLISLRNELLLEILPLKV